jgi:hypothetical protein
MWDHVFFKLLAPPGRSRLWFAHRERHIWHGGGAGRDLPGFNADPVALPASWYSAKTSGNQDAPKALWSISVV